MFRLCLFPKGEIGGIAVFALSVEVTGGIQYVVQITSGKFSVMVIFVVFGYIELNGAFCPVTLHFSHREILSDMSSRSMPATV